MENIQNNKKMVLISTFMFIVLLVLFFGLSRGYLTLDNRAGSEIIRVEVIKGGASHKLTLEPGEKKTLWQSTGEYQLKFFLDDKVSDHYIKLNPLGRAYVKPDIEEQRASQSLGSSPYACSIIPDTNLFTFYYPCNTNVLNDISSTSNGNDFFSFASTVVENLKSEDSVFYTKPYGNNFIKVEGFKNLISLQKVDSNREFTTSEATQVNYGGTLTNSLIATNLKDKNDQKIAVVATKSRELIVFYNYKDANPKRVKLDKALEWGGQYLTRVAMAGNKAFIFNGSAQEDETSEDPSAKKSGSISQKVAIVDLSNFRVEKVINIDGNLQIRSIDVSNSSKVLINAINNRDSSTNFYLISNKKINKLPVISDSNNGCWKDDNNFYYIDDLRHIFKYNLNNKISTLAYGAGNKSISYLNCAYGKVYFSIISDGDKQNYQNYVLEDKVNLNERLDLIFPISGDSVHDILSAKLYKDTITVKMIDSDAYENRNDQNYRPSAAPVEEDKKNILEYFKSQGINTDKYKINFSY